jgi:hypothetical protein
MDHKALLDELEKLLPIPTMGVGSSSGVITSEGYHDMAVALQVVAGEDELFHIDYTEVVTPENIRSEIQKLISVAREGFMESLKAVMMFGPYFPNVPFDEYIRIAEEFKLKTPLFGGVVMGLDTASPAVLMSLGTIMTDKIALLGIAGNARPVFAVQHAVTLMSEDWHKVTGSTGDTVYMIDDQTSPDFLREFGYPVDKINIDPDKSFYTLTSSPLVIMNKDHDMDMLPRVIMSIDPKAGSVKMSGSIPMGAAISVGHVRRPDIPLSAGQCMQRLAARMKRNETDGYKYSSVLVISCLGRYIVSTPKNEDETAAIVQSMPEGLTINGFYSWGEFCPSTAVNGTFTNHAYNFSIAMMSL